MTYYEDNKEKVLARQKEKYNLDKEKKRQYYLSNKENFSKRQKKYTDEGRRSMTTKRWYEKKKSLQRKQNLGETSQEHLNNTADGE